MAELSSNPRGIPKAPFIDKVENFAEGESGEALLSKLNETLHSYKRMEEGWYVRKNNLLMKIPELERSLECVQYLLMKGSLDKEECCSLSCRYELCDSLYANAKITNTQTVGIWLGANVMLEYSTEEAEKLLTQKLQSAKESLKTISEDLLFLKEQMTVTEVNIARVYNWDVKKRKSKE